MKRKLNFKEREFVTHKFVQDGCPESDAKNESWEAMVESLFDGNKEVAQEEFKEFCKKPWEVPLKKD